MTPTREQSNNRPKDGDRRHTASHKKYEKNMNTNKKPHR